ncbi:MAG: hypothetical protein JO011_01140 [Ktedonobacteraceae bacterium]|nr:hypothetical protein [Ktedonobacteraceae bacterium]
MSEIIPDQLLAPQRRPYVKMIITAIMTVLVIIASIIGFFAYHNNEVAQDHIHATATAIRTLVNNSATATTVSLDNAVNTAIAVPRLTATAIAISSYASFTKLSMYNPLNSGYYGWSGGPNCQMSGAGYQVSITRDFYINYCISTMGQHDEMAYQVMMSIHTGDCGGLVFGYKDTNNYYIFEVCQNRTYNLYSYLKSEWISLYPYFRTRSEIREGLNTQNTIAVTIMGNTINMYVNGKKIDTAKDFDLTGGPVRRGEVGLIANDKGKATSVIYTNAVVWSR